MQRITIEEAALQFPKLIELVRGGEDIIITHEEDAVARLTGLASDLPSLPRQPGTARHLILAMSDDFDAPLDDFREYQE